MTTENEDKDDKGSSGTVDSADVAIDAPQQNVVLELPEDDALVLENAGLTVSDEDKPRDRQAKRDTELDSAGSDEERERIREKRREQRARRKDGKQESNRQIEALQRQVAELSAMVGRGENLRTQETIGQIDQGIEAARQQYQQARQLLAEAIAKQDGEAAVQAQDIAMAARDRFNDLQAYKRNATVQAQTQQQPKIDPEVQKMSTKWVSDNDWYDPKGRDPTSRQVIAIDNALAAEGYDPKTADYWEELDDRVGRLFPHLKRGKQNTQPDDDDDISDNRQRGDGKGGKNITTGSGREGGDTTKRKQVTVSGAFVANLKEAGMWEQFQTDPKFRQRMLTRYKQSSESTRR